jgi:hypothetical protein
MIHKSNNLYLNKINYRMLFFTGYGMAPKRYIGYFASLELTFNPTDKKDSGTNGTSTIIITHSAGIIKALLYCYKYKINPSRIIAIDPPDISKDSIINRLYTLPDNLKALYNEFLDSDIKTQDYPIVSFRDIQKQEYSDKMYYICIKYYKDGGHLPYEKKSLRDNIIDMCTKPMTEVLRMCINVSS